MNKPQLSHARLQASLDAKIERYFDTLDTDPDVAQTITRRQAFRKYPPRL